MTEAERICEGVTGPMRERAIKLAENVLFIEGKLDETRDRMGDTPLVVNYDNGGGQKGIRKNPVFEAYVNMFRQYTNGVRTLADIVGVDVADEDSHDEVTPLAEILKMASNV